MSDRDPYDGKPSGYDERRAQSLPLPHQTKFNPNRPADALLDDCQLARTAQLVAMFAQLGDYGQRVTLAQMAAMLRVQAGA